MDSMDSEEAEFLEPEQDEAKFAHEDAVCIYIYSFEPEVFVWNIDVFFLKFLSWFHNPEVGGNHW